MRHPNEISRKTGLVRSTSRIKGLSMNIFVLDKDIELCARYHCDQHVSKMILESVQMMCTALNKKDLEAPYKSTHEMHPCVLWVGDSHANFRWLGKLARALNDEYKYRYARNRDHASIKVLDEIEAIRFHCNGLTEFAQAMPDQYRVPGNAVKAYRTFYQNEKRKFATWTRRSEPGWFNA
jgi:hypothetical protein